MEWAFGFSALWAFFFPLALAVYCFDCLPDDTPPLPEEMQRRRKKRKKKERNGRLSLFNV
jgi:hypothetical protein